MEWHSMFLKHSEPTLGQMSKYVNSPLWDTLNRLLIESYGISPQLEYSHCSMQRGWNIKYRNKGKNLCTLYPQLNYFNVLLVISERNHVETGLCIEACCDIVKQLYYNTKFFNGGKWLMLKVDKLSVLEDVMRLIDLKIEKK